MGNSYLWLLPFLKWPDPLLGPRKIFHHKTNYWWKNWNQGFHQKKKKFQAPRLQKTDRPRWRLIQKSLHPPYPWTIPLYLHMRVQEVELKVEALVNRIRDNYTHNWKAMVLGHLLWWKTSWSLTKQYDTDEESSHVSKKIEITGDRQGWQMMMRDSW